MSDLFSLQGKRILVTGGTRGVGRAISLQFARAGAAVVANYVRDTKAAEKLQAEAEAEGCSIEPCRADLTSEKGMEQLTQYLGSRFASLSGLVHCAATGVHRPFPELTLRHFDWTYALNVRAFFDLVQRLLERFERGANLLAVSSDGAVRAVPYYALIGSSKGALESLVRHLAVGACPPRHPGKYHCSGRGDDRCLECDAGPREETGGGNPALALGPDGDARRGGVGRAVSLFGRSGWNRRTNSGCRRRNADSQLSEARQFATVPVRANMLFHRQVRMGLDAC